MLHHKSTKIISELQKYFSSNEKTMQTLLTELSFLQIPDKSLEGMDKINTKYKGKQTFILLLLSPIFGIKDISGYLQSSLYQLYNIGKDVFYNFFNNMFLNWRKLSYKFTKQLIHKVEKASFSDNKQIKCLIADDTDFSKRGK
jgi:hypothetical protein